MSTKSEALKKREAARGAAKKKKIKIAVIVTAAVLFVGALVAGILIYYGQMHVDNDLAAGIDGVDLYFGESELRVKKDIGEPDRTEITAEDIREINYYYDNITLFGSESRMILTFVRNKLKSVKASINMQDGLYKEVIEHMREEYKYRDGYSTTDDSIVDQYNTCRVESLNDERHLICDINNDVYCVTFTEYVGYYVGAARDFATD